jgi:eukaryotic-like serine/threonine-protein kinase
MFRGSSAHSGVSSARFFTGQGGVRWRVRTGGPVRSSPAVTATRVFVGSADGFLYAVERATGEVAWRFSADGPIHASPAISNGLVIAATSRGRVFAVDERTGRIRWSLKTGKPIPTNTPSHPFYDCDYYTSSPVIADSTVVIGALDGGVYALNLMNGHRRWRTQTRGRIVATPAISGGTVVVGSFDGRVYALDLATGAPRWVFHTIGDTIDLAKAGFDRRGIQSSAAIVRGMVFVGSRDDGLYALDAQSGTVRWRVSHRGSWVVGSPAVDEDGRVFVGSSDGHFVQAVDATTGSELWHVPTDGNVQTSPLRIRDALVVGVYRTDRSTGGVLILDAKSGMLRWQLPLDGPVLSSPVASDGELYVGTDGGSIVAIHEVNAVRPRLAIYYDSTITASPFVPGARLAFEYFRGIGYEPLDRTSLSRFLAERINGSAPSAIVFATDVLAPDVASTKSLKASGVAILRQYLESGGKVVWLSAPAGMLLHDSSGKVVGRDPEGVMRLLGVSLKTLNPCELAGSPTVDGHRWGLNDWFSGRYLLSPAAVTYTLDLDEIGMTSSWVKKYQRDRPGSGYVQLWGFGASAERLATIRAITEYGLLRQADTPREALH